MRFEQPLLEGTLIRRSKRFQAEIKLENGDQITAHCANPGSLRGCAEPGNRVLVSVNQNPRLKFGHQLEVIYAGRVPVGVHMARPVSVVAEAIQNAKLPELAGYARLRRLTRNDGVPYADLVLEGNGLRACYLHIQNVTMAEGPVAYFPDYPLPSGVDAMSELTNLVREGNRAMIFLVAQRNDVRCFRPADEIDAEYAQALRDAVARGVEIQCQRAKVTKKGIELDEPLALELGENK